MPFKLKFQNVPRIAGKEEVQTDLKAMPDASEPMPDFGSLLNVIKPKQKTDLKHAVGEEKVAHSQDDFRDEKDDDSASVAQHPFMQPIAALEQMLDRRQHDESIAVPIAKVEESAAKEVLEATVSLEPVIGKEDIPQQVIAAPVPVAKKQESGKQEHSSAKQMASASLPVSGESDSEPLPLIPATTTRQEVKTASPAIATGEVKPDNRGSKPDAETPQLQEVATGSDKSTLLQTAPSLSQTAPKAPMGNIMTIAAPVNHPAVADVQVISDKTTGAARTLVIQLQPVELGTVTARLRLTSEGMHIQIAATSTAMAEHLSNDREALGKALHRAGVTDDASNVTISIVDRSSAGSGSTLTGQQNLGGQDQQQSGARNNGQGQSGFQNTPGDRSANQPFFGEAVPDDQPEKAAKADNRLNSTRGLVV